MTRLESLFHHCANLLVGGTGLVYAWMLYFATPSGEFSILNHPWQGDFHDLHLLTAPILVISVGMVWKGHAGTRLRNCNPNRRGSGVGLLLSFLPMMFSGYLLQVTVEESWRSIWLWVHLITSGLWLAAYAIHWILKYFGRSSEATPPSALDR
ncbi:MAG: hypothetical protein GY747_03935 [Planctomycetes bacterium]|nr:hypothetical protein [Planctomycetota bacterium]MCP4770954.1 hypothetical protein [Planctomycetota bacterium]MCP4861674.1 hypothetical protein [Planctomycetota bacterium]